MKSESRPLGAVGSIVALAAAYILVATASLKLAVLNGVVSPVWPPSGLALAALVVFGARVWPGLAIGAFITNAMTGIPLWTALAIGTGNTAEGLVALFVLRKLDFEPGLRRVRDVLSLSGAAATLGPAVAAFVGVSSLVLSGAAAPSMFRPLLLTWWVGDASGMVIVGALLLAGRSLLRRDPETPALSELALIVLGLFVVGTFVFLAPLAPARLEYPSSFVVFPFLVWAALRLGPGGAAVASFVVTALAVAGTAQGGGPFIRGDANTQLLLLQSFTAVASISTLALAAGIVEGRLTSAALRRTQARERALLEGVPDLIFRLDREGRYLDFHASASAELILPPEQFLDRRMSDVLPPDIERPAMDALLRALATGRTQAFEYGTEMGDKKQRWEARVVVSGKDEVTAVIRDVTSERAAEEALRESEERYRRLFNRHPQPVLVFDLETLGIVAVNETAVRHYGYSEAEFLEMTIRDIRPPEQVGAMEQLVARTSRDYYATAKTWKHRKKDGTLIDVEVASHGLEFNGRPARMALINDVTTRVRVEEQLWQSQKMEAIGRLAGGIAHDFNNLLTVVVGYSDLLLGDPSVSEDNRRDVAEIRRAGERATDLTRQLLAYGRKQVLAPQVFDLNGVVRGVERMLHRIITPRVELQTLVSPEPVLVTADPNQLEQVIRNLVINARDAMPDGGWLTISVRSEDVVPDAREPDEMLLVGRHAVLTIADTGQGMDEATRRRIFEPFYTTKEMGKGTGLGLAVVYGIVAQSGGDIQVQSTLGIGTTISILLPIAPEAAPDSPSVQVVPGLPRGTETILFAEDEDSIRRFVLRTLEEQGYRVLVARDGVEALDVAADHVGLIDLLLTDAEMPRMGGRELAERFTARHPEARVLIISGYTEDAIGPAGAAGLGAHYLGKPFTPGVLAAKLRDVLGGASSPGTRTHGPPVVRS